MIKRSCLDCKHTTDEMKYCSAYEFPGLDDGLLPGLIVNCERWELKIHNISTSIKKENTMPDRNLAEIHLKQICLNGGISPIMRLKMLCLLSEQELVEQVLNNAIKRLSESSQIVAKRWQESESGRERLLVTLRIILSECHSDMHEINSQLQEFTAIFTNIINKEP